VTTTITRSRLTPADVPPVPYSQGLEVRGAERLVFVSGQVGSDADGQWLSGVEAQTQQVVRRIEAVLAQSGLGLDSVVKLTVYLTDLDQMGPVLATAAPMFPPTETPAAATAVVVTALAAPEQLVEIEAIAAG
jgi:2-iminobutanoate/2-iminopropanoate deaminase